MDTVWAVAEGDYDRVNIIAVCSTEDEANSLIEDLKETGTIRNQMDAYECPLNPAASDLTVWAANIHARKPGQKRTHIRTFVETLWLWERQHYGCYYHRDAYGAASGWAIAYGKTPEEATINARNHLAKLMREYRARGTGDNGSCPDLFPGIPDRKEEDRAP
jgi:hypothetical protein